MSSRVEYPNLLSRIILKRHFERQFVIPLEPPSKLLERFMRWYERKVLDVNTCNTRIERPIFLIGLPRSGTTLLQDLLCTHPDIAYITNIMHQFRSCFCAAEDLRKRLKLDFKGERYLRDSIEIRLGSPNEGHMFFAEWRRIDPYALDYVDLRIEDFSPEELEEARRFIRKTIWCFGGEGHRFLNKNTNLVCHVLLLKDIFPDVKIIHIVRDARMCANSMLKLYRETQAQEAKIRAQWRHRNNTGGLFVPYPRLQKLGEYIKRYGPDNIRTTAHLWNDGISSVNEHKDQLPFFYEVRYEDILANPKEEIRRIFEFCELPEIRDCNITFWKKFSQIGIIQHSNQYDDFEVVETICRTNMQRYGYL